VQQINVNGYVSLSRPVVDTKPRRFPLGRRRRMIAAFWADVDLSVGGGSVVYYGRHGRDDEQETVSQQDAAVLSAATDIIRGDTGDVGFTPSSVAKITWKDVAPYPSVNTAATQVDHVHYTLPRLVANLNADTTSVARKLLELIGTCLRSFCVGHMLEAMHYGPVCPFGKTCFYCFYIFFIFVLWFFK